MDTLLDRFLRYVKVETTAVDETDRYPSSPGQLELGEMLAREMRELELEDVGIDPHGIVMGTLPGRVDSAPTIAWLAHMDTSPEVTGRGVQPRVLRGYDGGDVVLDGDPSQVIRVAETPELAALTGKTLITTDGTTLLGADDKAGIAAILTAVARLRSSGDVAHGPIRVVFTCDEEVGRGCDKIDIEAIGATAAYTLDGEGEGGIENETFSADLATVTITGKNTHPGLARGVMVNAIRLAGLFLTRLPSRILTPETTGGRDGFLHPYVIEGGVPETRIKILLRSFETAELAAQAELLERVAATIAAEFPEARLDVRIDRQYRNMVEHLRSEPRAVELAARAMRATGREPAFHSIRGGTDGSRLSELGLPTPNLSVGMHNFHSPLEFACLEEMEAAVEVLVELARLWGAEHVR